MKEKRNVETGKTDIDWRVEQKLARVIAERDLYINGFIYGFLTALIVAVFVGASLASFWPELKKAGK
jgi:hypothetical protein